MDYRIVGTTAVRRTGLQSDTAKCATQGFDLRVKSCESSLFFFLLRQTMHLTPPIRPQTVGVMKSFFIACSTARAVDDLAAS